MVDTQSALRCVQCDPAWPASCQQDLNWDYTFLSRSTSTFSSLRLAATFHPDTWVFPEALFDEVGWVSTTEKFYWGLYTQKCFEGSAATRPGECVSERLACPNRGRTQRPAGLPLPVRPGLPAGPRAARPVLPRTVKLM